LLLQKISSKAVSDYPVFYRHSLKSYPKRKNDFFSSLGLRGYSKIPWFSHPEMGV
jgi:hypothetical protein